MEECENIVDSRLSTVIYGRTTDNMVFYSYLPLWKICYVKILNNISEQIMTNNSVHNVYYRYLQIHVKMLMGVVSNLVCSSLMSQTIVSPTP
jgi:hypothetical protein